MPAWWLYSFRFNSHQYDQEGNRTRKYIAAGDVDVEEYEWDHHNRLVKVELYASGTLDQVVEYAYDPNGKLYKRTLEELHHPASRGAVRDAHVVHAEWRSAI